MIRVLLVGDDAEFRANLDLWLTRSGFAVCTAEDGAEALRLWAQERGLI